MLYFILIIVLSIIVLFSSINIVKININTLKSYNFNYYLSPGYFLILIFLFLFIGFKGVNDEYTKFFIHIPSLFDFINNFQFHNFESVSNLRSEKIYIEDANIISYRKGFLFTLIISFFKQLDLSPQSIVIFLGSSSVLLHLIFFKKFTPFFYIALLFYVSHELVVKEWISLRQAFASATVLPIIYCVVNKKIKTNFLIISLTTLFHYVSLISILILFTNRFLKRRLIFIILISAFIFYYLNSYSLILKYLANIHIDIMAYSIEKYFNNPSQIFSPKLIQQLFLIFIIVYNNKVYITLSKNFKFFNCLFNTYILGTALMIITINNSLLSTRLNGHFNSVEVILISYIIFYFYNRRIILILLTISAILIAYYNYVYLNRVPDYILFVDYYDVFYNYSTQLLYSKNPELYEECASTCLWPHY